MTENLEQEGDLDRVLDIVDQISGDRQASLMWLRLPLKEFDNCTPENLIRVGRVADLIGYLNSITGGFVG